MQSRIKPLLTFLILSAVLASAVSICNAEQVRMLFAGEAIAGITPPSNPEEILGPPNGAILMPSGGGLALIGHEFATEVYYDRAELAVLLGVEATVLDQADFLVFEHNGDAGYPFEDSSWTFFAGADVEVIAIPTEAHAQGNVSNAAYEAFFQVTGLAGGDWPYILIDLQVVNPNAEDFGVALSMNFGSSGSPEPDFMAILEVFTGVQESSWGAVKEIY